MQDEINRWISHTPIDVHEINTWLEDGRWLASVIYSYEMPGATAQYIEYPQGELEE